VPHPVSPPGSVSAGVYTHGLIDFSGCFAGKHPRVDEFSSLSSDAFDHVVHFVVSADVHHEGVVSSWVDVSCSVVCLCEHIRVELGVMEIFKVILII
jgi:hypothetical protein